MPKKSVREMSTWQRMRHSLHGKAFRSMILLVIFLGVSATIFGLYLFTNSVRKEYKSEAWHLAKLAAVTVKGEELTDKIEEILYYYERNKGELTEEEISLVSDDFFEVTRDNLHALQETFEAEAVYIGALDRRDMRMVYIIDSTEGEGYLNPGYYDKIDDEELTTYKHGAKISRFERLLGETNKIPAYISDTDEYGYLCTAGELIYSTDRYDVMAFSDFDMSHVTAMRSRFLWQYILIILIISAIIMLIVMWYIKRSVIRPINQLSDAAFAYSHDKGTERRKSKHFEKLEIHTGDEIEKLALTMKDMETELGDYIKNLTKVTTEKERLNTELDIARQIQEGMIPHIYPAFPDRPEFDIYASMNPAKEVGGDFYDFFLVDHDHLAMVMADVSGKGIPAALFMMASKILIGNAAKLEDMSPAAILAYVNNQICETNTMEMFVTVWLGILDIRTGKLRAANAGHEYPIVRHKNGSYELYKDKHGFVIGGMSGMVYTDYEIDLSPGDSIFQYTDGVTEATNADEVLFGTDRLVEALNKDTDADPEYVLINMSGAIKDFVGEAPQFDDITMLCMKYIGMDQG